MRALSRTQRSDRFNEAVTFELAEHVLCVLWRPGPRIGNLLNASCEGLPVDADLVQHEVIGRPGLDIPLPEGVSRKCFRLLVTMT
jgi:hypothetical protein